MIVGGDDVHARPAQRAGHRQGTALGTVENEHAVGHGSRTSVAALAGCASRSSSE
ncbi:hypothetical protein KBTX_02603 [wastewater metagenome]|uniref:Uncharacterized protein n=2 Tax=unclassified sequences TaxID=12908 RepID=A0A5B8RFF6_9ZZZZ|nr:hypothetical protein KBTEX_02603 [uncultured organism]